MATITIRAGAGVAKIDLRQSNGVTATIYENEQYSWTRLDSNSWISVEDVDALPSYSNPYTDNYGNNLNNGHTYYFSGGNQSVTVRATYVQPVVTYTLSFNPGATDATGSMTAKTGATSYIVPRCGFARDGYTFKNWVYTDDDGFPQTKNVGDTITLTRNLTLYAQWSKIESITISFISKGELVDEQIIDAGDGIFINSLDDTETEKFDYWYEELSDGSWAIYYDGDSASFSKDTTLYAHWTSIYYSITYKGNGATGGSERVQSNQRTYIVYENWFTRTGYEFRYWTYADEYDQTVIVHEGDTLTPTRNLQLFASWKKATYSITYNLAGGTGGPSDGTKTHGTAYTIPSTIPTKEGNSFQHWVDDLENSYDPGESYYRNANTTFTAVWKLNEYTVSYNANGGTGAPNTQTKYYGINLALSSTVPTRSGYDFVNWFDGTDYYSPGGTYTANSPASLYAQWRLKTYTISYNANGGTGAPSAQTKTHGVDLTLSSTVPTRDGYIFVNWFDGTDYYSPGQTYTANSPASLYAQWIKTYRVTYNGNHATGGSTDAQSGSVSYTIRECGFYKNGYYFKYWQTSSGTIYRPGDSITPSENLTLYAQWEARSYFYWHGSDTEDSAYFAAGQRVDLAVTATGWNNLCDAINKLRENIGLATIAFASVSAGDEISSVKYNIVSNAIKQIVNAGYGSITPVTVSAGQEILTSHFNGGNSLKAAFNSALAAV